MNTALQTTWVDVNEIPLPETNGKAIEGDSEAKKNVVKISSVEAFSKSLVSADELQTLEVPVRECVLAPWFAVGDYGILYAQRGVGKTWLSQLLARAISQGTKAGEWEALKARRVLYCDGEMPLDLTKERDRQFVQGTNNLFFLHHALLFERTGAEMNLTDPEMQDALLEVCRQNKIEVLFLDNQSTLFRNISETDGDSWEAILPWLLRLQRHGISVVLIVHAGRNNQARGHSRREDRASWMLGLTDLKHDEEAGARFVSEFAKPSRNCPVSETPPLQWEFRQNVDGTTGVQCMPFKKIDQFRLCLEQGLTTANDIAEEMHVTAGTVSKLAARGIKEGWCGKDGRDYALRGHQ